MVSVVVVEPVITKTIPKNADSLMNVHHLGEKRKADANKPSSSSKKKVPAVEVESAESDASQDADGTVAYNNQTSIAAKEWLSLRPNRICQLKSGSFKRSMMF